MRLLNAILLLPLLANSTFHTADKSVELSSKSDEKKQPLLEQKVSVYRHYKPKQWYNVCEWLNFMSHRGYADSYPYDARRFLVESLDELDDEAVQFYTPYADKMGLVQEATIKSGDEKKVKILLPNLRYMTHFGTVRRQESYELPYDDISGLATCMECADEQQSLKIADAIIQFYQPQRAYCDTDCTARCQNMREAFIAYGLAKALEKAIDQQRSSTIHYLLTKHPTFVTQAALQKASDQKNKELAKKLKRERADQTAGRGFCRHPQLLAQFGCLQEQSSGKLGYLNLANAVMSGIKPGYSSWNPYGRLCD